MAYKNVEVKCGGYEPLRVKDAYIQTFATSSTPNYDGEQYFDLTKPHDMITVGQSDTKTITFGSTIQISIDNTINTTYIQIFANGTRVDYHTLAQKRTEFYIVAVGDPDNQNGLGSVILETSSYNWCSRKCANSTVNAAIYELLNPSTWQNASINGINLGIDESNTYWKSQSSSDSIAQQSDFAGLTTNPVIPNNEFSTKFLIGDAQLGLRLYVSGSMCEWQPYKNGNAILPNLLSSPQPNNYYTMGVTLFIGYNDTIQEGQLMVKYYQDVGDPRYNQWTLKRSFTNYIEIYNWVKDMMNAFPIITHTWYSLTSISGNGLTIPLVKLASDAINDGDPVSDATTSAFDVLPSSDNNVRSLVNLTLEPISTDNAVTITYSIPALKDGSYSSVKVYAKIGEAPKCDETDDIVEDIDPTINEISLENLEFETEYFFCIQSITNDGLKLSSNVESITTGENTAQPVTLLSYMNDIWDPWVDSYTTTVQSGGTGYRVGRFTDNHPEIIFGSYNPSSGISSTSGNSEIKWLIPIKRYKATKMYISIRTFSGNVSYRATRVCLFKDTTLPDYSTYYHTATWLEYDIAMYYSNDIYNGYLCDQAPETATYPALQPQTRLEIDISSIPADQSFYFGFWKCNLGGYIQEITFDNEIKMEDPLPTDLRPLVDKMTSYKLGDFDFTRCTYHYGSGGYNQSRMYISRPFSIFSQDNQFRDITPTATETKVTGNVVFSNKGTVTLTYDTVNGGYNATYSFTAKYFTGYYNNTNGTGYYLAIASWDDPSYDLPYRCLVSNATNLGLGYGDSHFDSLNAAINYLVKRFRNIKLVIDGIVYQNDN